VAEASGAAVGGRPWARGPVSGLFALGEAAAGGANAPGLAGLASFTMTADGQILSWSAAAGELFGRTPQQAVGCQVAELLAPGHQDTLASALAAVGAGDCWSGSVAAAGPGGRQAIAFRWDPVHGAGGHPHVAVVARAVLPAGPDIVAEADRLLGGTLDLTETARQVLGLAVPRLADAGSVYLLEPLLTAGRASRGDTAGEAVVRRLAVYAADGAHRRWAGVLPDGEVVVFPPGSPAAEGMAAGRPVLFSEPDAGMEERLARTGEGASLISRYTSFLAAPLAARGEVAGLLLLARTAGTPAFGPLDMAAAEGLAARAGVCVDNARLFTQERRTAEALQRGLLPREMAAPAGLDVAHRYRPAGDNAIGGDWYDVIPLPDGRATVTVGDAMGHGPEAAAVMAQLRAATHVLADLELPPAALLHRLNRMAMTVTEGTFATCVCATVDPARGTCTIARAGHLPPIVALPDGSCDVIELPSGLPLGLGAMEFHATELTLPPGAVLALYTDGLVENRARTFDVGIQALQAALREVRGPLPAACDSIIGELCRHGEDDTTLVLVRVPGGGAA
jgi:PAS domain-containing protein